VNTGVNSTCKACFQSSRECTYPPSGVTATPKRPEATGIKQEGEAESKKKIRKIEDTGRRGSSRIEDALGAPILTRKVWDEIYEIFKLHFSTEMPFLHPPTFRNRMRQASFPRDPAAATVDSEDEKALLLGVLTLTARFHPELVAYHSQPGKAADPIDASEYYATALKATFGPAGITRPSLDGIQALLMLGLYEWGQTRGLSAWLYVGIAMRLAQSMGLAYEDDPDDRTLKPAILRIGSKQQLSPRELAIEKEVRRRTFWSCFIMDRMLSAGKYRPTMIAVGKLRVQLPCTDDQFLFVHNVQTGFLTSDWMEGDKSQAVNDDGVLGRYIRLVEIFGRFSEWSYAGGRRTEKLPPWDSSTAFYKLRQELKEFHDALPASLTFTEANLSAHIEKRNATTYASLHTLYFLCQIMLHREYIPFIPLRCQKPLGPLDEPTFPKDKFDIPEGFWEESAETIFRAARDIVEIVRTCQDNNALPESPQIGFAVWQAAFVCVYVAHFEHMDTRCYLRKPHEGDQTNTEAGSRGYEALTVKILKEMVPRLKMAKGYVRSLRKMHDYFQGVKNDYYDRFKRKPLGWVGGGLEQYKTLEKELKEFGSLEDNDKSVHSDGSDVVDQPPSRASPNDIGQGSVNGEQMQGIEAAPTPRNNAWAPINATSPPVEAEDRSRYSQGQGHHQYSGSYQQSPGQSSNPTSAISPSNGDSTPSVNSPYNQPYQGQSLTATYPSIPHHTMGPPNTQIGASGYPEDKNEAWITWHESISMANSRFDNYAQDLPMDWNGYTEGNSQSVPNFFEIVGPYTPNNPIQASAWS
jgi:hypothetical protein